MNEARLITAYLRTLCGCEKYMQVSDAPPWIKLPCAPLRPSKDDLGFPQSDRVMTIRRFKKYDQHGSIAYYEEVTE